MKVIVLPALNTIISPQELNYLKATRIEQHDIVFAIIDKFVNQNDSMIDSYWESVVYSLNLELSDPELMFRARNEMKNFNVTKEIVNKVYTFACPYYWNILVLNNFTPLDLINMMSVSQGPNYVALEINDVQHTY